MILHWKDSGGRIKEPKLELHRLGSDPGSTTSCLSLDMLLNPSEPQCPQL